MEKVSTSTTTIMHVEVSNLSEEIIMDIPKKTNNSEAKISSKSVVIEDKLGDEMRNDSEDSSESDSRLTINYRDDSGDSSIDDIEEVNSENDSHTTEDNIGEYTENSADPNHEENVEME